MSEPESSGQGGALIRGRARGRHLVDNSPGAHDQPDRSGLLRFARWRRPPGGKRAAGDDVHVDADRAGLPDDAPHDRATSHQFLPAAALAGADDDLGDLVFTGEAGDGAGRIVIVQLVPAGAEV